MVATKRQRRKQQLTSTPRRLWPDAGPSWVWGMVAAGLPTTGGALTSHKDAAQTIAGQRKGTFPGCLADMGRTTHGHREAVVYGMKRESRTA